MCIFINKNGAKIMINNRMNDVFALFLFSIDNIDN